MATDPANDIVFVLESQISNSASLGTIRHWSNLKGAIDGDTIWIRDITPEQLESIQVRSLPFKSLYYQKDNLLFPIGSLLPLKRMRSGLLWSPLDRILPVSLPSLNHNFFGIDEKVQVNITASSAAHNPIALITDLDSARHYIETAAKVRLQNLSWIGIDAGILIYGSPLLPIDGQSYWQTGNMLLPTGSDFEFPILHNMIQQNIDPSGSNIIVWQPTGTYMIIPMLDIKPLTISSFRLTYSIAR